MGAAAGRDSLNRAWGGMDVYCTGLVEVHKWLHDILLDTALNSLYSATGRSSEHCLKRRQSITHTSEKATGYFT